MTASMILKLNPLHADKEISMKVVLVGASKKPERYAYLAFHRLIEAGHEVILFNPALDEIEGYPVCNDLRTIKGDIHTVTLYVGEKKLIPLVSDIIDLKPKRIISNPGTECAAMRAACEQYGIEYIEACTLVMLKTRQF